MKEKLKLIGAAIIKSGIVTWVLLLGIWWLASIFTSPDFLPNPYIALQGFIDLAKSGKLWEHVSISLYRVAFGWGRALLIGIPIGLLIGRFKVINWLVEPFINFFRFVPAIGFLTLFLMWFGIGEESKRVLITYAALFPIIINTVAGVNGIDPIKYQAAESLGANRVQSFFTVTIPGSVPSILTGVRLGLSGAIISIVGAEMLAANEGLGYLIYTSRLYFKTDWIFVGIFVLGLLGFIADRLLRFGASRVLKRYGVAKA